MTYIVLAVVLALVGAPVLLAAQAFRSEYLVAFRHRGREFFLFERGADGRYALIAPVEAPLAVWRFARERAAAVLHAAPQASLRHVPGRPFRALQRSDGRAGAAHA
ncbi:MAG TPA: hypothetical protein VGR37_23395 [Longimicrobiaceae bacterium]|nr:hypothetical protein [Longimicrobiaceae bacterium]